MVTVRNLLIIVTLLVVSVFGLLGFTGWNYYSDYTEGKTQTAVDEARLQGQVQMLNTIYREASLRGQITLASILSVDEDEDGRPDRGDAIFLIITQPPESSQTPGTLPAP